MFELGNLFLTPAHRCQQQNDLLPLEIIDLFGEAMTEAVLAAFDEIGIEQRCDILRRDRTIGDTAFRRRDLNKRFEPQKPT